MIPDEAANELSTIAAMFAVVVETEIERKGSLLDEYSRRSPYRMVIRTFAF